MAFAENTTVPVEKSRAEIESVLKKYGAEKFISGWDGDKSMIGFQAHGKLLRFVLPLPDKSDKRFAKVKDWGRRTKEERIDDLYEAEIRRRWRSLALAIKAKLEVVATGISAFEDEFLAHIVLPNDGRTVGEALRPQLDKSYETGKLPPLLGAMG